MVKVWTGEGGTNKQVKFDGSFIHSYPCHETSCKS